MDEDRSGPRRLVLLRFAVLAISRDMGANEGQMTVHKANIGAIELCTPLTDRLHFLAGQYQATLECLEDLVVVTGLAVVGVEHRGSTLCYHARNMRSSQSRMVVISTGTILRVVGILATIALAWVIRDILLIVFTAMLLAGVVYPLARFAQARHVPKGIAVFIFYLLLFGTIILLFSLLVPRIVEQMQSFVGSYSQAGWLFGDRAMWANLFSKIGAGGTWQTALEGIKGQTSQVVGGLFSTVGDVFGGLVTFFAVLVLSFYMILEESAVKTLFHNLVPNEYQELASRVVWQMIDKLGGWMRGQLVLGLIIGILYFLAYWAIGLPYALLLALLGGLLEFIPYIGPFIAAVPAVILGLSVSPTHAVVALVATIVIQRIENDIVVPKVMQKAVGLNPIVSLIAFMIGAKLFGIVGAIFSIPVATAASVVLAETIRFQKEV